MQILSSTLSCHRLSLCAAICINLASLQIIPSLCVLGTVDSNQALTWIRSIWSSKQILNQALKNVLIASLIDNTEKYDFDIYFTVK
jgi:hypothetical protein